MYKDEIKLQISLLQFDSAARDHHQDDNPHLDLKISSLYCTSLAFRGISPTLLEFEFMTNLFTRYFFDRKGEAAQGAGEGQKQEGRYYR